MRRKKAVMEALREKALSLIEANPTLSMSRVASHFGVSVLTVDKWFKQKNLKRWAS